MSSEAVRLSVIIPVHGVEDYLEACLTSVLGEPMAGLEVIAVDDASPDRSGAILDEWAARDPRLRVEHLDRNVGLAEARNHALTLATGDYVLFLDSDDLFTPGALEAVRTRAAETSCDVVLFGYELLLPDGSTQRTPPDRLLSQLDVPDTFTATDHPEVLGLPLAAWSRAFRREFLLDSGLRFITGNYEDLSVTLGTTMLASRLTILDRRCYRYRQRPTGAITATVSERHFAVFERYDEVFTFLARHPECDRLRGPLLDTVIRHELHILTSGTRVPPSQRRRFFDRIVHHHRTQRPPGWRPPPGREALKHILVAIGSYRLFEVVRRLSRVLRLATM